MTYQITVVYPNGQVLTFQFDKPTIFCGRQEGNDIRLAHSFVSSRHFQIERRGIDGFFVSDIGSTNGTLLNGQPLKANIPQKITHSDTIQVGSLDIRVEPIVDATIIEKISKPLPTEPRPVPVSPTPSMGASLPTNQSAAMWQVQTGMYSARTGGIQIDDHRVASPRREMVTMHRKSGFEQRILGSSTSSAQKVESTPFPWGILWQAFGVTLILACLAILIMVMVQ